MEYQRYDIAYLAVDGEDLLLRRADLLVVQAEGNERPDWECIAYGLEGTVFEQGAYRLTLTTLTGEVLTGDAILVRSHQGSHVWRGAGPLDTAPVRSRPEP